MLWGPLDFLQQFPRVYLEIVKAFTSTFDYSYYALRLPSYVVGTFTIFFCYRLMNKMYGKDNSNRFLFVMILVSACTFTDYYVQIKQYTMDLLMSLVALWQCIELLQLKDKERLRRGRYVLLCASFLAAPFFSYTYPVVIAPVFVVLLLQGVVDLRKHTLSAGMLMRQWFPLFLSACGIVTFYFIDVKQLMADQGMHKFWGHLMMDGGFSWSSFFMNCYNLFAEIGAGMLFWYLFGILGISSFLFGVYSCVKSLVKNELGGKEVMVLYSSLLLILSIVLFVAGKLPLGEPRLNAFAIPAVSILMIFFLDNLRSYPRAAKFAGGLSVMLYIGVIGNIYTTFYASITGPEYTRKMEIFKSTENALKVAELDKLPIVITPAVAWPYDNTRNLPYNTTVPGDWVLKTFPAYTVSGNLPVYGISSLTKLNEYLRVLPPGIKFVLVGDGLSFRIVSR